ncbi:DEAD/DEAH box helicase family protein [Kineococcus sp. T13]|uniref:SNF2-related protein n=1 Tax=Kineococcus vitellinus TaxID=2696565 RepID=UPI0014130475|nr:DEAD/DEAH box helicase family protein [Kineococcus vitellinus]
MTLSSAGTDSFTGSPGSVVEVRDEEWLVTGVERATDGWFVQVQGLTELVRDTSAVFSTALDDVVVVDPKAATVVADDSPGYRRTRLWLESVLRKSPVPLGDPELSVATRGLADPLGYQQAAVRKALDPDNLRPRILLADAVGLGKTLEIGMILAELVRRGRGERILIVTPRHVLEQMQFEMWTRFALPFVRLDSVGIQRIRQKLPANRNPFAHFKRVIVSIDTLKSDRYVAHLQKQNWDAVVIDESHNVTNSTSQNNRLARTLAAHSDALILASATPHNGRAESFAELVRMLDPSAVLPDGEIVEEAVERLVVRRHRHSPDVAKTVGGDWAERLEPRNLLVDASSAEDAVARELDETWLHPEGGRSPYSGKNAGLFPWTLAKAFLSSPVALRESIRERIRRLGASLGEAERREIDALRRLDELAKAAADGESAKYTRLLKQLRDNGVGPAGSERSVVFAERVATLKWLRTSLQKDLGLKPEQVALLHGGLTDREQQDIVESFKQASSPIRILVTGDVASEGVNLHSQCHDLVHFDIPWSLIRIEQRNGRIDRYGQKHRPQITTLLLNPSSGDFAGDIRVLQRLLEKEHEAHRALGDSASLMGKYDVAAEEDAIRRVLAEGVALDDVVQSVEQVASSPGLEGLFARLTAKTAPAAPPAKAQTAGLVGVYESDVAFLRDALEEFIETPGEAPPRGVAWKEHTGYSLVEFAPPADLRRRLEVLPQPYLATRRVTERFVLATTVAKGRAELTEALADTTGSLWPEGHFLAPLHPVLDWAGDRALAALGRREVFAVRGSVESVNVLLQGTLTNARGQVVASSFLVVEFPNVEDPQFSFAAVHPDAATALAALGFTGSPVNEGALADAGDLTRFLPPAVDVATGQLAHTHQASRDKAEERVQAWFDRSDRWTDRADADDVLIQRSALSDRRHRVREVREAARLMAPDRSLVRPLLVVVPQEFGKGQV